MKRVLRPGQDPDCSKTCGQEQYHPYTNFSSAVRSGTVLKADVWFGLILSVGFIFMGDLTFFPGVHHSTPFLPEVIVSGGLFLHLSLVVFGMERSAARTITGVLPVTGGAESGPLRQRRQAYKHIW